MTDLNTENIYYLGPDGSNSYTSMEKFLKVCNIKANHKIPQRSIKEALDCLKKDKNALCVLPIENSIEGIVRETIDNLIYHNDEDIQIMGEVLLPIKHNLLAKTTDKTKIKKVISHLQALAQCKNFLYENYPEIETKEVASTSYAAQKVASIDDESVAAIANETCATLFNLNILDKNINDEKDNATRFYLLGRNDILFQNKKGKTAIVVSTKNKSGALCGVLQVFAKYDINLTYIDSRPSKKCMGEYVFFMELDGLKSDERIIKASEELNEYIEFMRVLGSFYSY